MGFPKAMDWDEEKLRTMAVELVGHMPLEQVPRKYEELYDVLKYYAKTGAYIDWAPPQRKKEDVSTE